VDDGARKRTLVFDSNFFVYVEYKNMEKIDEYIKEVGDL
jgi:ribosomal protein S18